MRVPPISLSAEFLEIQRELEIRLKKLFQSGQYILGDEVREFENRFAKLIGTRYAVGVASGTDALLLSLAALGIGRGDEVITTPLTYIATGNAIARAGAKPIFVDIDPETFNLNTRLIEKAVTRRTKAIIPVHLYGMPCDMAQVMKIAKRKKLHVIEDCAQATGAKFRGRAVGSFGSCGAFSFYPTKILGAYGDGGMITTNDRRVYDSLVSLRSQSDPFKHYVHKEIGFNSRLDTMQAAVLNAKMKRFHAWNKSRERLANAYDGAFSKSGFEKIIVPQRKFSGIRPVFHQYTIRAKNRDALLRFLKQNGISAGIYYPIPLHLQPCFRHLGYRKGSLPEAEKTAREIISLPIFPQMKLSAVKAVVSKVKTFFA